MSVAIDEEPRLIHSLTGRMRINVPAWEGRDEQALARALRDIGGVRSARVNAVTGNALISFDPTATNSQAIMDSVRRLVSGPTAETAAPDSSSGQPAASHGPRVVRAGKGRARVAVRGLDRDPGLAKRVVDQLQRHAGVRATASALTGRVLIEYDEHQADLDDLISEVSGIELPDTLGEDRPSHPLDPAPLVQSATRVSGAAAGLGLLAARRLAGVDRPPIGDSSPAVAAGIIGIVQGFPATRNGVRALLGRHLADLLFQGAAIVSLALSGNPLGLALTGAEALRLLTETTARRAAWRRYEQHLPEHAGAQPGATIRLEAGERVPRGAQVIEGTGTAVGRNGLPRRVAPGEHIAAGSRCYGGPFVLTLDTGTAFTPEPRPAPVGPSLYSRYHQALGPASLIYAGLTAVLTRSVSRTFAALLLVTPRTAVIGAEAADLSASARVLRAGVTVVGTRPNRPVRRPGLLLLDSARMLTDGLEVRAAVPLREDLEAADLLALAAGVGGAAGWPFGGAFPRAGARLATDGRFDGAIASATIDEERYTLGPLQDGERIEQARHLEGQGHQLLVLRAERHGALGVIALRPRLAAGAAELVATCAKRRVEIGLLASGSVAAQAVARRAGVALLHADDAVAAIRARQADGTLVAYAADSADAAPAFAACDLAIGISSGRSGRFPARADLLAPDLGALAAIVEAGARREAAVMDAVAFSAISNVAGAAWGLRGAPGIERASQGVYLTALVAMATGWLRLRGGRRPGSVMALLTDPHPERWGRRGIAEVLQSLQSTRAGLSAEEAARRRRATPATRDRSDLARALLDQARSPLTGILVAAGGLTLLLASPFDVGLIAATIAVNVAVGAWQERRAGQAAVALERTGAATAHVLRDGALAEVHAAELVPGDVLVLASGDRIAADARVIEAHHLEVDEAALTGESFPVPKLASGGSDAARVVLEGSDVTVGTGHAVVVAVGRDTRMGATAAALAADVESSPLGQRLSRLLRQFLPLAAAGGAIVVGAGVARGRPLLPQLAVGATIALAAVPEGLPLLTGVAQAGTARRLATRNALVRRLSAVEALGRVDVACTDKTGTLTEGKLALTLIATLDDEASLDEHGPAPALLDVLRAAALASPHPAAADAAVHPTDAAIIEGARRWELGADIEAARTAEAPFDPVRAFHVAVVGGQLLVKGSTEALAPRCMLVRTDGGDEPIDDALRDRIRTRAETLASRGLRVLMVAAGTPGGPVADPRDLVALGFVGISDPLRPEVPAAVRRCRAAGIRTIMLTGDHPATARAIAREAGLLRHDDAVLTGTELADLQNGDLDRRLEGASVIARVTPLDKLRIVESLQRSGHVVAMTGDGVNDAPALRLADVGVAMGRGGTEVARQAADVVLADDHFATLVDALVEGRSFWQNMRRALGLLLGGNLGELGLVVGASMLGMASPLVMRQILAVNLITDALPALAVSLQPPAHQNLAALAREGAAALDAPLRDDVLRRGTLSAVPALAAYVAMLGAEGLPQARTVAFASIVATQLAQTLEAGWAAGGISKPVVAAVAGSAALLLASVSVPALRQVLQLTLPSPLGWTLIGGGTLVALAASRAASARQQPAPGTTPIARESAPPLRLLPVAAAL